MAQQQSDSSKLRKLAQERETKQNYINTIVLERLKLSHAWITAWINKTWPTAPDIDDHHPVSPWNREWNEHFERIANMETSLHPISYHHPCIEILEVVQGVPLQQLPITGDNINVSEITQEEQPIEPTTTSHQVEMTPLQQEIILQGREKIRNRYQELFTAKHPGEAYFPDRECMPGSIKVGILFYLTISTLLHEGHFPDTEVLVKLDPTLSSNQIICE